MKCIAADIDKITKMANLKKRIFMTLCALVFISLLVTSVHAPVGWHITTVDSEYISGFTSIALDSTDNPHISYCSGGWNDRNLMYARWSDTGPGWITEIVDSEGDVGDRSSIALDSGDNPHISYVNWTSFTVKYAKWTGTTWSIETVDSGDYTSIALDSDDNPHISYRGESGVKYAKWTGTTWSIETVDLAPGWGTPSVALDSSDNPHICYVNNTNGDLKYAKWTGTAWDIQVVDVAGQYPTPSLALDSGGRPHISYHDANEDLKYAKWTSSAWSFQIVHSEDYYGDISSLALDSSDNPHISYRNMMGLPPLQYARWTGTEWLYETLDTMGCGYDTTSIKVDSSGNPHIAYSEDRGGTLKYATVLAPLNLWSSDSVGNPQDVFVPGETVYVTCPKPRTYWTTVSLYVVADQTAWNEGDPLTDVSGGAESATLEPGPSGTTQTFQIWPPPLALGNYDIVMDKDNDGVFDAGLDLADSVLITGFNVIPEVPFGTAITFLSMLLALVGFAGFKRFRPRFMP